MAFRVKKEGSYRKISIIIWSLFFFCLQVHQNSFAVNSPCLEIEGLQNVSHETIVIWITPFLKFARDELSSGQADTFPKPPLDKIVKALYSSGCFKQVNAKWLETERILSITVKEKPLIKDFYFYGNKYLSIEEMRETLELRENKIFLDTYFLESARQVMLELYKNRGYHLVEVTSRVDLDEKTNKAEVDFRIIEDEQIVVGKIDITGNYIYGDREIKKLMKTKEKMGFFSLGLNIFCQDEYEIDKEKILSHYYNTGFARAELDDKITIDKEEKKAYISIDILEGPCYRVNKVAIKGMQILDDSRRKKMKQGMLMKEGKIFNLQDLLEDIDYLRAFYSELGFLEASVDYKMPFDEEKEKVDIIINIEEKEPYCIKMIKIKGNKKTSAHVVKRELLLSEGNLHNGYKAWKSKQRLESLGYFEYVYLYPEDTPQTDEKNLIVEVRERSTVNFEAGIEYNTIWEESLYLKWTDINLFGWGKELAVDINSGKKKSQYRLTFLEPRLFNIYLSLENILYREETERFYFKDVRQGGNLILGVPLSLFWKLDFLYKYENLKYDYYDYYDYLWDVFVPASSSEFILSSITPIISRDSRDNSYYPLRGSILALLTEISSKSIGSDGDYVKLSFDASKYLNLFWKTVFTARLRLGKSWEPEEDKILPCARFYAGGQSTVRGYEEGELSPPWGGEGLSVVNLEYRIPLFPQGLIGSVFYDTGSAWDKWSDFNLKNLNSSYGLTLSYQGINFTYAYNLTESGDRFYIFVGGNL